MKIENEFTVNVPVDEAWQMLTDLERIAPCMPGAQLTGRDGDAYLGKVKVKVGPVISEFSGTASFIEKDDDTHHAVIDAKGRDSRGSGNASAIITAQLRNDGESRTVVSVETDLKISGKLAQFGSGMIGEVSSKLLAQFADSLEKQLMAPPDETVEPDGSAAGEAVETAAGSADLSAPPVAPRPAFRPTPEPEAVNLTQLAGGAVAKRLLPVIGLVVVAAIVIYVIVRR
jgi:carbon monoxide dehydrogenase subunit G